MPLIDKALNLENKILKIINNDIKKIKNGYEIKHYEINHSIYYACSKIICNNGFIGTIWDIEVPLNKDLIEYKKHINRTGFLVDNTRFYIDTKIINLHDLNIKDIKIISINNNK